MKNMLADQLDSTNPYVKDNFIRKLMSDKTPYQLGLTNQDCIIASNRYYHPSLFDNTGWKSQELEEKLFWRGSVALSVEGDKVQITDYATIGKLNALGGLDNINLIGFDGSNMGDRKVYHDREFLKAKESPGSYAVILQDYTGFLSEMTQRIIPRHALNNAWLQDEVECYQLMVNSLIVSAKKAIGHANTKSQAQSIMNQLETLLNNRKPIDIVYGELGRLTEKFELFQFNTDTNVDNYKAAIDFFGKKRRSMMGIPTPDTITKTARVQTAEVEDNDTFIRLTLEDGLHRRIEAFKDLSKFSGIQFEEPCYTDTLDPEKQEQEGQDTPGGEKANNKGGNDDYIK